MRILILTTIMLTSALALTVAGISNPGAARMDGGAVAGEIKFTDAVPKPEKLLMNKDADTCGVTKLSDSFIVSPQTKGLKNVVLSIEGVSAPAGLQQPVRITQKKCWFEPHVQVAQVGATLEIVNGDRILHNIHSYLEPSKRTIFNLAQPIQNQVNKVALKDDGVITVKCDIHNWMSAYIVVKKHPYFAISDENGFFRIGNVPPGRYKLQAWHEELGSMAKDVVVTAGAEALVNFEIGK